MSGRLNPRWPLFSGSSNRPAYARRRSSPHPTRQEPQFVHPGTRAAPQLRSAAGRPDGRLARRRESNQRRPQLPRRSHQAGRMLSTHFVESGVPLAVFSEPSAFPQTLGDADVRHSSSRRDPHRQRGHSSV